MTLTLSIDGKPTKGAYVIKTQNGFDTFHVLGETLSGRVAPVSQHSGPVGCLTRPCRWRTSGHVYEVSRV